MVVVGAGHQVRLGPTQCTLRLLPQRQLLRLTGTVERAGRNAQDVFELLPEVLVQAAVQHGVGAGGRHAHHMAHRVAHHHRLRRELLAVRREIGDQIEQVEGQPADAEDDGDRTEQDVCLLEAAAAQLTATILRRFVAADEAGGEAVAQLVGDAHVSGLRTDNNA